MKRLISLMLCLVLILSVCVFPASGDGEPAVCVGSAPVITSESEVRVPFGIKLLPNRLIKIYDAEDGVIDPYGSAVVVTEWPDTGKLGTQPASFAVKDSDGNIATHTMKVTVYEVEHCKTVLPAVAPTCRSEGLTEGSCCAICGEVFAEQETIPKTAHVDKNCDGVCDECGAELHFGDPGFNIVSLWQRLLAFFRRAFSFLPFC